MYKYCYWSVADGKHAEMMKSVIRSARNVGVKEDFHIWSDTNIDGAINHECGNFDKSHYLFKFKFLKEQVSALDYDFFVFLDADSYFVRNPGNVLRVLYGAPIHVCLESDCTDPQNTRPDWWGCPLDKYVQLMRERGVKSKSVFNTNAGFWIVKKEVIDLFYNLTMEFWQYCKNCGFIFTEEAPLAYAGHMLMADPYVHTLKSHRDIWASDWTGNYANRLPDGKPWQFEDYMSGYKFTVNPAIVHAMRSKEVLMLPSSNEPVEDGGFWSGHQMLGDVVGFVAAAHLMYVKTGKRQKVWFQESRKQILDYFDGVDWVPRESIPNAVDAGRDPSPEEWSNMNGVKRFYKWMDPSLTNPKSFDIYMNCDRIGGEKLIGLITHANTQGPIPDHIVDEMVLEARKQYPEHKIVAIGVTDNKYLPAGVEDMRQSNGDIKWIVEMIRKLDLLITPQTGPCFIAAGLGVPMWVYRSKEAFWDNVLNYDNYKVERWWEREKENVFDEIYSKGGWDGVGSGSGSLVENNREYIWLLHKIIDYTPSIKKIVDIGCGDWQIMKELKLKKSYLGIDVSKTIIDRNFQHKNEYVDFKVCDVLVDNLSDGDLCIIKDVLQHLPQKDVFTILEKIKKYKYCLITNDYADINSKKDINAGQWRPINVLLEPYNIDGISLYGYNGKHVVLVKNEI